MKIIFYHIVLDKRLKNLSRMSIQTIDKIDDNNKILRPVMIRNSESMKHTNMEIYTRWILQRSPLRWDSRLIDPFCYIDHSTWWIVRYASIVFRSIFNFYTFRNMHREKYVFCLAFLWHPIWCFILCSGPRTVWHSYASVEAQQNTTECDMMTSYNGNIFRVTGPLLGESSGHRP